MQYSLPRPIPERLRFAAADHRGDHEQQDNCEYEPPNHEEKSAPFARNRLARGELKSLTGKPNTTVLALLIPHKVTLAATGTLHVQFRLPVPLSLSREVDHFCIFVVTHVNVPMAPNGCTSAVRTRTRYCTSRRNFELRVRIRCMCLGASTHLHHGLKLATRGIMKHEHSGFVVKVVENRYLPKKDEGSIGTDRPIWTLHPAWRT